jgi:hypothetical protein
MLAHTHRLRRMRPGPPPSSPTHVPHRLCPPISTALRPLSAEHCPPCHHADPLLLLHLAPAPPCTRPLDPILSPAVMALNGAGRCHAPFPLSPSPRFPLRVKLAAAHYTPPRCLLSEPGHWSIPEAISCHCPTNAEVLASTSHSGRPPVPLSRRRAPH